jgi:hypothetical protein
LTACPELVEGLTVVTIFVGKRKNPPNPPIAHQKSQIVNPQFPNCKSQIKNRKSLEWSDSKLLGLAALKINLVNLLIAFDRMLAVK